MKHIQEAVKEIVEVNKSPPSPESESTPPQNPLDLRQTRNNTWFAYTARRKRTK